MHQSDVQLNANMKSCHARVESVDKFSDVSKCVLKTELLINAVTGNLKKLLTAKLAKVVTIVSCGANINVFRSVKEHCCTCRLLLQLVSPVNT